MTYDFLMQNCSNTYLKYEYSVPKSYKYLYQAYGVYTSNAQKATASTLEYCLLFILHSENCFFLGEFQSSKILVSTAGSAVSSLVEGRAAGCGEGATAPAFHS
jgi:hypothetical protein